MARPHADGSAPMTFAEVDHATVGLSASPTNGNGDRPGRMGRNRA
ncbi:hypothetical protein [Streptomyces sp. NRRL B-24085]|nr:hypothetical protein [Streptomyces sp. NRRL B-24085]